MLKAGRNQRDPSYLMVGCSGEPGDTLFHGICSSSPSEGTPAVGSYGCTPQSLPKFQHPSHELLKENGFTQHVYHKYRRRCLNGKKHRGRGRSFLGHY